MHLNHFWIASAALANSRLLLRIQYWRAMISPVFCLNKSFYMKTR